MRRDTEDEGMGIAVGRGCCRRREAGTTHYQYQPICNSRPPSRLWQLCSFPPAVRLLLPPSCGHPGPSRTRLSRVTSPHLNNLTTTSLSALHTARCPSHISHLTRGLTLIPTVRIGVCSLRASTLQHWATGRWSTDDGPRSTFDLRRVFSRYTAPASMPPVFVSSCLLPRPRPRPRPPVRVHGHVHVCSGRRRNLLFNSWPLMSIFSFSMAR